MEERRRWTDDGPDQRLVRQRLSRPPLAEGEGASPEISRLAEAGQTGKEAQHIEVC